jgi:predicted ATPase
MLVGPNGAGKSTILQAIDLLGGVVRSTLPAHIEENQWEYGDLPHLRSEKKQLVVTAVVDIDDERLEWKLTLGTRRYPGIHGEEVWLTRPTDDRLILLERQGRRMWRLDERTGKREAIQQTLTSSWLAAIEPSDAEDLERFPHLARLGLWARNIHGHLFLDPVALRSPGRGDHEALGPHGENLAPLLLGMKKRAPNAFARILKRVRAHYPQLHALELKREAYGWTHLEVEERWNGERARFNARQVSDGLLRLIAIATMRETEQGAGLLLHAPRVCQDGAGHRDEPQPHRGEFLRDGRWRRNRGPRS